MCTIRIIWKSARRTRLLDNVTFTGYKRYKNTSGEALQIDPVHSEKHFKAYQLLDDTPCKNITVKNCKFTKIGRASCRERV